MEKFAWFKHFPGAITVTDAKGHITEMNEGSAEMFRKDGGYGIMGRDAINCHPEPTRTKVQKLYETQQANIYSIQKNGKKQLVYQTPIFVNGKFDGFVEICLPMPDGEVPHFNRDIPADLH